MTEPVRDVEAKNTANGFVLKANRRLQFPQPKPPNPSNLRNRKGKNSTSRKNQLLLIKRKRQQL
jgi:hypothetical protein